MKYFILCKCKDNPKDKYIIRITKEGYNHYNSSGYETIITK